METAIIKEKDEFVFFDRPIWGEDYEKDEVYGVVDDKDQIDVHECISSALWEDTKNYVDELQGEEKLPEGQYLVLYFRLCENMSGLDQCVDFDISKEEIIENVKAQKYREEARYYPMSALHKPDVSKVKKSYRLAVTWELSCYVEVEGTDLADAMEKFNATAQYIPLPRNAEYVDTSFRLVTEDPDEMLAHVKPVNN